MENLTIEEISKIRALGYVVVIRPNDDGDASRGCTDYIKHDGILFRIYRTGCYGKDTGKLDIYACNPDAHWSRQTGEGFLSWDDTHNKRKEKPSFMRTAITKKGLDAWLSWSKKYWELNNKGYKAMLVKHAEVKKLCEELGGTWRQRYEGVPEYDNGFIADYDKFSLEVTVGGSTRLNFYEYTIDDKVGYFKKLVEKMGLKRRGNNG